MSLIPTGKRCVLKVLERLFGWKSNNVVKMKSIKAKKISDKIVAKHCKFNGVDFDSLEERDFYVRLLRIFGNDNVMRCGRVELIPSTQNSPAMTWDIDFKVHHKGFVFLVEYKGLIHGRREHHREFFTKLLISKMITQLEVIVFSPDNACPKWQTQDGLKPCPNFYSSRILNDADIYDIFQEKVQRKLQNV